MNAGVALFLVVLVLWGPTALWLIYHSTRSAPEPSVFQGLEAERRAHPTVAKTAAATRPAAAGQGAAARKGASSALWGVTPAPMPIPSAKQPQGLVAPGAPAELAGSAAAIPTVCAYLGTKDDPATRFDFPYAGNECHAGLRAGGGAALGDRLRQMVLRGKGQGSEAIGLDQQATLCLTAAHVRCPRYLQVMTTPAAAAFRPSPGEQPQPPAQPVAPFAPAPAQPTPRSAMSSLPSAAPSTSASRQEAAPTAVLAEPSPSSADEMGNTSVPKRPARRRATKGDAR